MLLKTMKCMMTIKYRMALSWGRHSIRHIKLPLSKGGSLLRLAALGLGWVAYGGWRFCDKYET